MITEAKNKMKGKKKQQSARTLMLKKRYQIPKSKRRSISFEDFFGYKKD